MIANKIIDATPNTNPAKKNNYNGSLKSVTSVSIKMSLKLTSQSESHRINSDPLSL